jgi:hypothetical protein
VVPPGCKRAPVWVGEARPIRVAAYTRRGGTLPYCREQCIAGPSRQLSGRSCCIALTSQACHPTTRPWRPSYGGSLVTNGEPADTDQSTRHLRKCGQFRVFLGTFQQVHCRVARASLSLPQSRSSGAPWTPSAPNPLVAPLALRSLVLCNSPIRPMCLFAECHRRSSHRLMCAIVTLAQVLLPGGCLRVSSRQALLQHAVAGHQSTPRPVVKGPPWTAEAVQDSAACVRILPRLSMTALPKQPQRLGFMAATAVRPAAKGTPPPPLHRATSGGVGAAVPTQSRALCDTVPLHTAHTLSRRRPEAQALPLLPHICHSPPSGVQ